VEWYARKGLPYIAQRFHAAVLDADALLATPEAGPPRASSNPPLARLRTWPVKGFDEFWIYYLRC
jgi:toxin ParE1/3/4